MAQGATLGPLHAVPVSISGSCLGPQWGLLITGSNVRVLEQPAYRRLVCWQACADETSRARAWGLPWYIGPREWAVQLGGRSLTTWSALCSPSLSPREPPKTRGIHPAILGLYLKKYEHVFIK